MTATVGTKFKDTCASPPFTNVCVPVAAYTFRSYPPCFPLSQRILRPTRRVFSHPSLISSSSPNSRACCVSNVRGEGCEDVKGDVPRKHLEQLHCVSCVPLHPNASHVSRSHTVAHQKLQGRRQPDDTHAGALKVIVIVGVVGVVGFDRPCSACRPFGTVGVVCSVGVPACPGSPTPPHSSTR